MIVKRLDPSCPDGPETENAGETASPALHPSTIKDMHQDLRPREKAEKLGVGALTLPELWALVIGSGTRGHNVLQVCTELMERSDNHLPTLSRRSLKQISEVKGLGKSKALQVLAVMEITKRYQQQELPERPSITSSKNVFELLKPEIGYLGHEEIWILLLNRRNQVVKMFQASKGSGTAALFDVKGIMKEALLEDAQGMVMAHNHPSGQLRPSADDDRITLKCREACRTMEIAFLDHIIVTSEGYYSYRDNGKL